MVNQELLLSLKVIAAALYLYVYWSRLFFFFPQIGGDPVILAIGKLFIANIFYKSIDFIEPNWFYLGDTIKQFPVPKLTDEQVVDTNGAGDAFVGGFFAQYLKQQPLEKCIDCGIWISEKVVQRSGCTFPDKMDYQ